MTVTDQSLTLQATSYNVTSGDSAQQQVPSFQRAMGSSRHPSRLTVVEVFKRKRSNRPSAVRQPISLIAQFQSVCQIPVSQQHRRRNTPDEAELYSSLAITVHIPGQHPARRFIQTTSSVAINHTASAPQRPTPTTTSTRLFFLAHAGSRKKRSPPKTQEGCQPRRATSTARRRRSFDRCLDAAHQ
jgi:hypothetical protein